MTTAYSDELDGRHHSASYRHDIDTVEADDGMTHRLGSPELLKAFELDLPPVDRPRIETAMHSILEAVGEDPQREGLLRTPDRIARAYEELLSGYRADPVKLINGAVFNVEYDDMVIVRDIEFYSLCEHHMLPFFGHAHVAYISNSKVIGLSKIPRIVDMFARRLQVQERLTGEIAEAIAGVLAPHGVGVVVEAYHLCMMMRGVEKQNSKTITSALLGCFRDDARTRDEFLRLAHGAGNGR